ncbi:MAG TPA: DUF1697 domain-containing protein [Pyrinomonadaceae bacterium]|nr:DUF1697 domain-containing protein [Pyrinomonadaceae bacterium]
MKYVALLRGINVGGKNKVKMETLRAVCAAMGFENVKTYINSGNVIFETAETDDKTLAERIEKGIEQEFLLKIKVMVRSVAEIEQIIKNNPFEGQFENEKDLHVFFLDEELSDEKSELLLSNNNKNEMFAVQNREIFCLLRISVLESLMGKDYIGKKLKVSATARNWRTVGKILELAENI